MDHVRLLRSFPLALAVTLAAFACTASAQQPLKHPGRVVEIGTNRPLEVEIKAWPDSRETTRQGDCPLFGSSPADSTLSKMPNGGFELRVDVKYPTYTTTYCAANYHPRADRDVQNRTDHSTVIPNPVEIYPRKADPALYASVVTDKTLSLLNDLAYLQSISPSEFERVVGALASERRRELVKNLTDIVRRWGQLDLNNRKAQ